jgi:hypothetical protein
VVHFFLKEGWFGVEPRVAIHLGLLTTVSSEGMDNKGNNETKWYYYLASYNDRFGVLKDS